MRTFITSAAIFMIPLAAFSAEKHVHGEAELYIALEGKKALIELESPADNILGFEHMPKTDAQKAKVATSLNTLKNASSLVALSGGNCQLTDSDIESPFSTKGKHDDHDHEQHAKSDKHHDHDEHKHEKAHDHHDHDEHKHEKEHDHHDHDEHKHDKEHAHHGEHKHGKKDDHHDHGDHDEDVHSSFHILYTYSCDNAEQVTSAKINAFEQFGGFEKIKVNWVKGSKQGSKTTTKTDNQLSF